MTLWIDPQEIPISPELLEIAGQPLLARVLAQRGITTPEAAHAFLDASAYQPALPAEIPGLTEAADLVQAAILRGQRICVWGDFDVDGQTSTTILVSTLRQLGGDVFFHIPVRAVESHGVNLPWLERVIDQGAQLVLTCDTGITAHTAVEAARQRGVMMVITDHHDLPPELPPAAAVATPRRLPGEHPMAGLSGAGVAYKLAEELFTHAGSPAKAEQHLDLAALGLVADVAQLTGDARWMVQRGLESLRQTQRLGLQEMMRLADLSPAQLSEEHIGFELAPRLNALGRLSDANVAVEFLTTDDLSRVRLLAAQMEGLNAERKLLTDQVLRAAQEQMQREPGLLEQAALVLWHTTWPAGVIGIVASRLAAQYHRPVVLLSAPPGETARGSARSVEGCNITAALAAHAELLTIYGGHPMAAGLSLPAERLPELRRALVRTVAKMRGDVAVETRLTIDAYLGLNDLSLELAQVLERLAPFGAGNPPLVLATHDLLIRSSAYLGRQKDHVQLLVEDPHGTLQKVIWWQGAGLEQPAGRFDLAYAIRAANFRGETTLQVTWIDARSRQETPGKPAAAFEVVDHRLKAHPLVILQALLKEEPALVWAEGEARTRLAEHGITACDRRQFQPTPSLVIWSTPPGWEELKAALDQVKPNRVQLFSVEPGFADPQAFLTRLAGLVKYALNRQQGQVSLLALACATAQGLPVVRKGLAWLAARGDIAILAQTGDAITLAEGNRSANSDAAALAQEIQILLEETLAYRQYFIRADDPTGSAA